MSTTSSSEGRSSLTFGIGKRIGSGTFGIVYQVPVLDAHHKVQTYVAIKRNIVEKNTDFTGSVRELDLLLACRGHPHVVQLVGTSRSNPLPGELSPLRGLGSGYKDDKMFFIFEKAITSINRYIRGLQPMSHPDPAQLYAGIKDLMLQLVLGVEFLHCKGIIHRDLKPSNLLLFEENTLKISDLGMSLPWCEQGPKTPRVVTSWYRAPEICLKRDYGFASDMWSLGCILYEMLSQRAILEFLGESDRNQDTLAAILKVCRERFTPEEISKMDRNRIKLKGKGSVGHDGWMRRVEMSRPLREAFDATPGTLAQLSQVLEALLTFDPKKRATASDLLNLDFFRSLPTFKRRVEETRPWLQKVKISNLPITFLPCRVRRRALGNAASIFNANRKYPWYSHRILFQAISIWDRYLLSLDEVALHALEHDINRIHLYFLTCVHLATKFFISIGSVRTSFDDILDQEYEHLKGEAETFEYHLLDTVLKDGIYTPTVFEAADDLGIQLKDAQVAILLDSYINTPPQKDETMGDRLRTVFE